jgi:hypothetical protein
MAIWDKNKEIWEEDNSATAVIEVGAVADSRFRAFSDLIAWDSGAIAALGITLAVVPDESLVAAILAPVIGVMVVFTGHTAGPFECGQRHEGEETK